MTKERTLMDNNDSNKSSSSVFDANGWKIYVVIPAYNESKIIKDVLGELKDKKWNMVIVDDGSSDKTFEIAEKSLKNYNGSIYRHSLNRGVGAA
ncbi:MAG: glycosyltransferase, partial [Methanobacterium sp.]